MRYFFAVVLFLSISTVHAQLPKGFRFGSYTTTAVPIVHAQAKLLLKTSQLLLVETSTGQELKFTPDQIGFIRIGNQRFIPTNGTFDLGSDYAPKSFAEVLDSGRVVLMRYVHTPHEPSYISTPQGGTFTSSPLIYLVSSSATYRPPTALPNFFLSSRKKFNQALAPFVPSHRADLSEMVTKNLVSADNILSFIHALNTGQPFK